MFSLEMVVQAVRSSLGSPEKLADSEQEDRVYEKDEGFGGDCGAYALKLARKKAKEGHGVQIVFCANVPVERIGDLLDEGTLYHVAVMLDSSLDEIYDASGKVSVQYLKDFCRDEYRDPEPDIWAVEYKADGSDDDKKIEKVIRNATAWSEWPKLDEETDAIADD